LNPKGGGEEAKFNVSVLVVKKKGNRKVTRKGSQHTGRRRREYGNVPKKEQCRYYSATVKNWA